MDRIRDIIRTFSPCSAKRTLSEARGRLSELCAFGRGAYKRRIDFSAGPEENGDLRRESEFTRLLTTSGHLSDLAGVTDAGSLIRKSVARSLDEYSGSFQVDFFSLSHRMIVACKFWAWRPVARDRSCQQRRISLGHSHRGRAVIRPSNCIVQRDSLCANCVGDCSKVFAEPGSSGNAARPTCTVRGSTRASNRNPQTTRWCGQKDVRPATSTIWAHCPTFV